MYDQKIIDSAMRRLSHRRQQALLTAQQRREELSQAHPRLEETLRQLGETGPQLVKAVLARRPQEEIHRLQDRSLALQEEMSLLLKELGLPADYLEPSFHCTLCQDTGFQNGKRCSCLEALLKEEACRALPTLDGGGQYQFSNFSLDYYSQRSPAPGRPSPRQRMEGVLAKCRAYVTPFLPRGESLLFIGRTGLGKTHLSLAVAGEAARQGFGVVYASAQGICDRAERVKFGRDEDGSDGQFLRAAYGCDLLVLDDLGSEYSSPLSNATLFDLVNSRLLDRRATLISTNLSPDEMERKYSERLVSRLLCGYAMLYFEGEDIRQQKRLEGAGNQ